MPRVAPLGVKDFVLVRGRSSQVLNLQRGGICMVLFFDSEIANQVGLLNSIGAMRIDAQVYSLDVRRFRAVAASSLGTTTEIKSTPKIIAYVEGDPASMFSANRPKTQAAIREFIDEVLAQHEEEAAPPPPPRRRAGGGGGGGRQPRRPVYEEDPDEGTEFIVPPGVKPHNTPWVEVEDEY